jgi:hypothetical protein
MSELKPVSRPPFLLDGRGGIALVAVVIALLVVLVKPWGTGTSPGLATIPTAEPTATATPTAAPTPLASPTLDVGDGVSRPYDPLIFGDKELQPTWGLWPAGYLVTFGFAMNTEPTAAPAASPAGSPSRASLDPGAPLWPEAIDIPLGNHLLLIGVSTPRGYRVDTVSLTRSTLDGGTEDVPTVRPPSPWPTHFTVIGIDVGRGSARTAFWTPGTYELSLTIEPGAIARTVEVRVDRPPTPGGSQVAPSARAAP